MYICIQSHVHLPTIAGTFSYNLIYICIRLRYVCKQSHVHLHTISCTFSYNLMNIFIQPPVPLYTISCTFSYNLMCICMKSHVHLHTARHRNWPKRHTHTTYRFDIVARCSLVDNGRRSRLQFHRRCHRAGTDYWRRHLAMQCLVKGTNHTSRVHTFGEIHKESLNLKVKVQV